MDFAEAIYCNHGRTGNATFSCGFAIRSNSRCHTIIKVDLIWYIGCDTKLDHDDPRMNAQQGRYNTGARVNDSISIVKGRMLLGQL